MPPDTYVPLSEHLAKGVMLYIYCTCISRSRGETLVILTMPQGSAKDSKKSGEFSHLFLKVGEI